MILCRSLSEGTACLNGSKTLFYSSAMDKLMWTQLVPKSFQGCLKYCGWHFQSDMMAQYLSLVLTNDWNSGAMADPQPSVCLIGNKANVLLKATYGQSGTYPRQGSITGYPRPHRLDAKHSQSQQVQSMCTEDLLCRCCSDPGDQQRSKPCPCASRAGKPLWVIAQDPLQTVPSLVGVRRERRKGVTRVFHPQPVPPPP